MKRLFDLVLGLMAATVLPALLVRLTSLGPVYYWSDRVGQHIQIFKMSKFRSTRIDTTYGGQTLA